MMNLLNENGKIKKKMKPKVGSFVSSNLSYANLIVRQLFPQELPATQMLYSSTGSGFFGILTKKRKMKQNKTNNNKK